MINTSLPDIILDALKDFQRHRWVQRLLTSMLAIMSFSFIALLLLMAGDAWLRWADGLRLFCSFSLWTFITIYALLKLVWPLIKKPDLVQIAQDYEQQFPDGLHQQISSAVDFSLQSTPGSEWMAKRCIAAATQRIHAMDFHLQLQKKSQRRLRTLVLLLTISWLFLLTPEHLRSYTLRSLTPWLNIPRPTDISFSVEPGNINVASGTDITLRIRCTPKVQSLDCVVRWSDGHQEVIPCTQEENGSAFWTLYVGPALDSFSYVLRRGNAESQRYHVQVGAAAEVVDTSIQVTPPHYIKERNRILHSGDTDVLVGSQLVFSARIQNFEVHHANLKGDDDWSLPLDCKQDGDDVVISGVWQAEQSLHCSLHLWNQEGLHHQHPQQWFIRVNQDSKPVIQLDLGLGDIAMSAANDSLQLHVNAEDDFGIENMALRIGSQHGILLNQNISIPTPQKNIQKNIALHLEQWPLMTGDRLWAEISCRDNSGQTITSDRAQWTINNQSLARLAKHINIINKINEELQELLQQTHVLANRWSDIRSNARIDDIHAQSGDLLQADQHVRSITNSLHAIHQQLDAVFQNTDSNYRSTLETPHAISNYLLQHHCPWLQGRGALLLQSDATDLNTLLDHTVVDSELMLKQCERLLAASQAAAARFGTDVLESELNMNQSFINFVGSHLLGKRLWHESIYHKTLRCSHYVGIQIEGKPKKQDNRHVKISNDVIPDIGQFNFALHWQGEIFIPIDGQWAFDVQSDDGVQLAIDGQEILGKDAWKTQAVTGFNSSIALKKGWHRIEIRYFQTTGESKLSVQVGVKGAKSKDINSFQLRSPSLYQNKPEFIARMLLSQQKDINWKQTHRAIQSILDASLYIHNWAIVTEQPQIHRIAQQLSSALTLYQQALDKVPFLGDLQQALSWKPIQIKSYFQQLRLIIDAEIKSHQLPIERQIPFDDLIIHIHFMQELSKSLKDWGLPYEQIAQTHRYLKRLKEQLIVLHQRSLNELSSRVSNTKYSFGERRAAWEMSEKLGKATLDKITGLEVDSQNVIWQLSALYDSLINIYLEHKDWRTLIPTELADTLTATEEWKALQHSNIATEQFHIYLQDNIMQSYHNRFKSPKDVQSHWYAFNNKAPRSTVETITNFLKPRKRNSTIEGPSLKHLWQLALLESEYLFKQGRHNEAKSALYIAIRLQQQLDRNDNKPKDIRTILETAKHIARNKSRYHEALLEALQTHEDQHIQLALRLDLAFEGLPERVIGLVNALAELDGPQELQPNTITWSDWRTNLENLMNNPNQSLSQILLRFARSFKQTHAQRASFIKQLELASDNSASQAIRWQRLAKDLQSINADEAQQNSLEAIKIGIDQERQLHIYCFEQASYSRNNYLKFAKEDDNAITQLTALLSLRDAFHETNAELITNLKRIAQSQSQLLNTATSFIFNESKTDLPNEEHIAIWKKLRSEVLKSENELKAMRNLSLQMINTPSRRITQQWTKRLKDYLKHMKLYWKNSLDLQEQLSATHGQSALMASSLLARIDITHLQLLHLYHQHATSWINEKEQWDSLALITQQCIADFSINLDNNKRLLLEHYNRSPNQEESNKSFTESWQRHQYLTSCISVKNDLFNGMINDETPSDQLLKQSADIVDTSYAHAARLLHQRGQHVPTPFQAPEHQQLFLQQSTADDFQRRYEQQWQQTQTLIEMRSPYENYDAFTNDQQLTIFDYFKTVSASEP